MPVNLFLNSFPIKKQTTGIIVDKHREENLKETSESENVFIQKCKKIKYNGGW